MAHENIETPALASSESDASIDAKVEDNVVVAEKDPFRAALDNDQELEKNPFADPDVAEYWRSVYEKSQYECRAVFDPTLEWTAAEEKKLIRKLDWHVCLWAVSLLVFPTGTIR